MRYNPVSFAVELWTQRELLWQFTRRHFELTVRGSQLGLIWSLLNPLLMLAVYLVVFGYIFQGKFGIIEDETPQTYGLGIFLGLTLYNFITSVLGGAPGLIVANTNFVKKVIFPLEILPAASTFSAVIYLFISLLLVCSGILLFGPHLHLRALWFPIILAPLILFGLGLSWFLSALGVFFRDVSQITGVISTILMWGSGVFFSAQQYPAAWLWLRYNPILLVISLSRDVVLWNLPLNLTHLIYIYTCAGLMCLIGHLTFAKLKSTFADVL